jgi:hypothetical protein
MHLTISIPVASHANANRKHPAFVVSATNGLNITATNASSAVVANQSFDVSSSSPSCTPAGSLRTCSLVAAIPVGGPYTFTLTSYDQAPVGGVIPVSANVLAIGVMTNATVVDGTTNAFSATLDGVPSTTSFATSRNVALQNGTPANFSIPVGVEDASSTAIVGAFGNALTAGVIDSGGHTLLSIDGGATKSQSVQLQSSTDAANLVAYYDGGGASGYGANVAITGPGTSGPNYTLDTFGLTGTVGFGTPTYASNAAKFTAPSQQLFLSPVEGDFAGTFTESDDCSGFLTVSPSGPDYDLLSVSPTASCHVTISDGTLQFVVPVSVTTTGGSIGIPPPSGTVTTEAYLTGGMSPYEITTGPDGKEWFAAHDATDGELGSVDTHGTISEYPIPNEPSVTVAVGPDGRIWSGDYNDGFIHAIDPTTHVISTYDLTAFLGANGGVAAGPDGNMWFTDFQSCSVDIVNTSGVLVNQVQVQFCSGMSDITEGPDGYMWVGDVIAGQMGRINPTTYTAERFPSTIPGGVGRITIGHDGAMWFTLLYGGGVGRMSTTGAYTFYQSASATPEFGIVSAPDTTLIFSSCGCSGGIDRITTGGTVSSVSVGAYAYDFAVGTDGGVWYTDYGNNAIGRLQP